MMAAADAKTISASSDDQTRSRAGYYDTLWPSEHTDLWRSHTVFDAGLPAQAFAGSSPVQLQVESAKLNLPVWGYTRDKDQVFVIGGSPFMLEIFTKGIVDGSNQGEREFVPPEGHPGSVPFVAKVNPLTMQVQQVSLSEGKTINYTGGLLIHANGFVYAVVQSVLYKIDPERMEVVASLHLPLLGQSKLQQFWTTYNGMQVIASGQLVLKGFSFTADTKIEGVLMLINPDTLTADVTQSAWLSSARLTIDQSPHRPTYLYLLNATESFRYRIEEKAFVRDDAWTRTYREDNSGSTQASSPLFFGKLGEVVFADNTAPGAKTPINLFAQPTATDQLPPVLNGIPAFSELKAGYNFMMVAGDPFSRQLVVYYDPANKCLSTHRVFEDGHLELVWERNGHYKMSASPAVVSDRDLLYIDNYQNGVDHFVVLRLSTGSELASVPLQAKLPTIGTIFVGMNDDVFILNSEAGTTNGLISRITVAKAG